MWQVLEFFNRKQLKFIYSTLATLFQINFRSAGHFPFASKSKAHQTFTIAFMELATPGTVMKKLILQSKIVSKMI